MIHEGLSEYAVRLHVPAAPFTIRKGSIWEEEKGSASTGSEK